MAYDRNCDRSGFNENTDSANIASVDPQDGDAIIGQSSRPATHLGAEDPLAECLGGRSGTEEDGIEAAVHPDGAIALVRPGCGSNSEAPRNANARDSTNLEPRAYPGLRSGEDRI